MTAHPINGVTAPDTLPITVFNVYFRFDQKVYNTTYVNQPINPRSKSTRLNSSHVSISYAVFCLKKKKDQEHVMDLPDHEDCVADEHFHSDVAQDLDTAA